MNTLEMVKAQLLVIGADGLVNTDAECGCDNDDLSPGSCLGENCQAAKHCPWTPADGEWIGEDECHRVNGVAMTYKPMEVKP